MLCTVNAHHIAFVLVIVDQATHEVHKSQLTVHLTPTELSLLSALIQGYGRVLTHRELLLQTWAQGCAQRNHYRRI